MLITLRDGGLEEKVGVIAVAEEFPASAMVATDRGEISQRTPL